MTLFCIGCGCSEDRACMTEDGPCRWISTAPPVCSACSELFDEAEFSAPAPANDDLFAVGPLSCAHAWLYTDRRSAYCVRCGEQRSEEEAA